MPATTDLTSATFSRRASARFVTAEEVGATDAVVLAATGQGDVLAHGVDLGDLDLADSLRLLGFSGEPGSLAHIPARTRTVTVVGVPPQGPADALAVHVAEAVRAVRGGLASLWRMPLRPHFTESLRSEIADLNNVGDLKMAQALIAATFLQRFAPEGVPFAHLDIAGPAFNHGAPYAHVPAGGTGYGVATLLELLRRR